MSQELNTQVLQEKWAPVLEASEAGTIQDSHRKAVTAVVLENQERANKEAASINEAAVAGDAQNWDPVLISLVRRSTPNLIAFDVAGVQPMTGPTGLIFAMKSTYDTTVGGTTQGDEALFNEPDTAFTGPISTAAAETTTMNQMGFTIDKTSVTAQSRALKANYTVELAQDLKAIHGLSAETELANILSTEILAEINREIITRMNTNAVAGTAFDGAVGTGSTGGRWEVEVYKNLITQIEKAANSIAISTRRGKGNFAIVSPNVAAVLNATGSMQYGPTASMNVDATGNLFAGTLNGGIKVYIDPFATTDYVTVGYKGSNAYDAGMFYCPYVPLSMMKTIGENDFQPRIGFKTRYGMADNPFVTAGAGANVYYKTFAVTNI
jgi:hypothetical protein